jgi:formate dehydrogenase gamma subunit
MPSYIDNYHGLKSKEGDQTVANCASCHGGHRILPQSDSTSSINPANLQATCGHCHRGITPEVASVPIHRATPRVGNRISEIVANIYIVFIALTMGFMGFMVLIDFRRQVKAIGLKEQVVRMTMNEVVQHYLLTISFITLVVTGFALRFSDSWWVKIMFGWEGGFPVRGIIHRVAAILFIIDCLWHLAYMLTPRGRKFIRDMFPAWADARDLMQMIGYNLGMRKEKPEFGRFGYIEKMEYWALVWGGVVMTLTGIMLWFENRIVHFLPKEVLSVALVIHYYEAWLATLAILLWHGYSVIFNPSAYPMNPAWWKGKMPRDLYEHEHSKEAGENHLSPKP